MSDIANVWDANIAACDFAMSGTQLAGGADLPTAILISVFSDRIAETDDALPDASDDARGWWGDMDEPVRVGSRIWLLERSKQTAQVPLKAKDYLAEALQWLINDGVVAKFDIDAAFEGNQLRARVVAYRRDGKTVAQNFSWVWGALTPV